MLALAGVAVAADDVSELQAVLDQQTDVATRTKMNADYVPGMLTILQGDELETLGAQTVLDALSLVPGIQTFKEKSGYPNLSMRGITYPFNTGNTKVLINGISASRENAGVNSSALLMRIEQVDRIEVIRGPSSGIYGAFAFAGVINIITRTGSSRAFVAGGTDDMGAAGVVHTIRDGASTLTINTAGYRGSDNEGPKGLSPDATGSDSVLQFERGAFTLTYEAVERGQTFFSPITRSQVDNPEHSSALNLRQRFTHSAKLDSEVRVNYTLTRFGVGEDIKEFVGDRLDVQYELHWRPVESHAVLVRTEYAREIIDHGSLTLPALPPPPLLFTNIFNQSRQIYAASVQDQVELTKKLTLTAGLRGDFYSDVGSVATPRVALVYRANSRDIIKAQYAQGFRPPTYFEQFAPGFSDDSLNFEVIGTSELGFARHGKHATTRLTLFYSRIRDVLFPVIPPLSLPTVLDNNQRIRTHGAEAEWQSDLTSRLRVLANVSLVDTFDSRLTSGPGGASAAAADVLGNLAAVYRPSRDLTLAARLRHVGTRHVASGTTAGYDTFDLTATLASWPAKSWTTRVGAKNLFDDRVTYLEALPGFTDVSVFEPRTAWARVTRAF